VCVAPGSLSAARADRRGPRGTGRAADPGCLPSGRQTRPGRRQPRRAERRATGPARRPAGHEGQDRSPSRSRFVAPRRSMRYPVLPTERGPNGAGEAFAGSVRAALGPPVCAATDDAGDRTGRNGRPGARVVRLARDPARSGAAVDRTGRDGRPGARLVRFAPTPWPPCARCVVTTYGHARWGVPRHGVTCCRRRSASSASGR
jgi:hypothetical protein